jgi:hypothetical protein
VGQQGPTGSAGPTGPAGPLGNLFQTTTLANNQTIGASDTHQYFIVTAAGSPLEAIVTLPPASVAGKFIRLATSVSAKLTVHAGAGNLIYYASGDTNWVGVEVTTFFSDEETFLSDGNHKWLQIR